MNPERLDRGENIRWRRAGETEWEYGTTLAPENGQTVDALRLDGTEWTLWVRIAIVERVRA